MCTAHREPRYSSITTIGTTFHIQHRSIQTKSTPHPTPQPKNSKLPRHNVPHPTPKHTDKSQHRTPHHNQRTQNSLGTTFRIQHRSIQTKVNTAPHATTQELKTPSAQRSTSNTEAYRQKSTPLHIPTTQELLKKSPRGVQRGRGFTAPLRFSTASQSKKKQALCQESKNKPNHTINKEKE